MLQKSKLGKDKRSKKSLDDKIPGYKFRFITSISSVCIDECLFTNFVNERNSVSCENVKRLLKLNGKSMPLKKMPVSFDTSDVSELYNYQTTRIKEKRFNEVFLSYGVNVGVDIDKHSFKKYKVLDKQGSVSYGEIRVIAQTNPGFFDIYIIDVNHLLASDVSLDTFNQKKRYSNKCLSQLI